MRAPKVRTKWRPPLALIVYVVLLAIMAMPFLIVLWFRAVELDSRPLALAEICALVAVPLLTLATAYVLVRTITAPIDALVARTEDIARRGKDAIRPLESYGTREIATLSQGFIDLASTLVDRTEYIRTFAAHVSHELKSPLTAISGAAELLRDDEGSASMTPEQRRRFLDNISADARRLDRLLVRLRDLAHAELPVSQGQTSVAAMLPALAARFPGLAIRAEGETEVDFGLPPEAAGIVFANLAENAAQHGATRLDLTVSMNGHRVVVEVSDNGTGIPEANRSLIFQPFFTTRREEGGTGLGLDIIRAMLNAYQATIRLREDKGPGAAFEITLPMALR